MQQQAIIVQAFPYNMYIARRTAEEESTINGHYSNIDTCTHTKALAHYYNLRRHRLRAAAGCPVRSAKEHSILTRSAPEITRTQNIYKIIILMSGPQLVIENQNQNHQQQRQQQQQQHCPKEEGRGREGGGGGGGAAAATMAREARGG